MCGGVTKSVPRSVRERRRRDRRGAPRGGAGGSGGRVSRVARSGCRKGPGRHLRAVVERVLRRRLRSGRDDPGRAAPHAPPRVPRGTRGGRRNRGLSQVAGGLRVDRCSLCEGSSGPLPRGRPSRPEGSPGGLTDLALATALGTRFAGRERQGANRRSRPITRRSLSDRLTTRGCRGSRGSPRSRRLSRELGASPASSGAAPRGSVGPPRASRGDGVRTRPSRCAAAPRRPDRGRASPRARARLAGLARREAAAVAAASRFGGHFWLEKRPFPCTGITAPDLVAPGAGSRGPGVVHGSQPLNHAGSRFPCTRFRRPFPGGCSWYKQA